MGGCFLASHAPPPPFFYLLLQNREMISKPYQKPGPITKDEEFSARFRPQNAGSGNTNMGSAVYHGKVRVHGGQRGLAPGGVVGPSPFCSHCALAPLCHNAGLSGAAFYYCFL